MVEYLIIEAQYLHRFPEQQRREVNARSLPSEPRCSIS
jgi:hypothetical protein